MYKLQRFFDIFWKSLTDKSYYKDILGATFSFSLKYLYIYLFIFSLATTLRVAVWAFPKIPTLEKVIENFQSEVSTLYPQDLVVTVDNGEISTNQAEPYAIPLPKSWGQSMDSDGYEYLVVIDTKGTAENFSSYKSIVLVTKTSFVYPDQNGFRVQQLEKDKEVSVIDKKKYDALVATFSPFLKSVRPFAVVGTVLYVIVGPWVGALFGLLGHMFYLLFFTPVILMVARMLKLPYGFSELYRLSMHGLTLPILIIYMLSVFGYQILFLFTGIFIFWMTIVLNSLRDMPVAAPPPPQV